MNTIVATIAIGAVFYCINMYGYFILRENTEPLEPIPITHHKRFVEIGSYAFLLLLAGLGAYSLSHTCNAPTAIAHAFAFAVFWLGLILIAGVNDSRQQWREELMNLRSYHAHITKLHQLATEQTQLVLTDKIQSMQNRQDTIAPNGKLIDYDANYTEYVRLRERLSQARRRLQELDTLPPPDPEIDECTTMDDIDVENPEKNVVPDLPYMNSFELSSEFPKTVGGAVEWLESVLSEFQLEALAGMNEGKLLYLHCGLGIYIRNSFQLWDNPELKEDAGTDHDDDASAVIIRRLWEKVQANPQNGDEE